MTITQKEFEIASDKMLIKRGLDMVFIDSPYGDNIKYKYCHGVG